MRLSNRYFTLIILTGLLLAVHPAFSQISQTDEDEKVPFRFGHAFFNPDYLTTPLDNGNIFLLSPLRHATLNVENTGDFTGLRTELFHPDLATAGRPVFLSSLNGGLRGTRVLWNGRPFRDTRTCRSDLSLLPPAAIGGFRSVHWGGLGGVIAPGAVIDLMPLEPSNRMPLTYLTHRDGYYEFGPVEFIHSRQVSSRSHLIAGGFIPSSIGRLSHGVYTGHILYGRFTTRLDSITDLTLSYMSNTNRHEIPFTTTSQKTQRNDLDITFRRENGNNSSSEISAYRAESKTRVGIPHDYWREIGAVFRSVRQNLGLYIRISHLDGILPGGSDYSLIEVESTAGYKKKAGRFNLWFLGGGSGYWIDRVKPVIATGSDIELGKSCLLFLQLKQSSDPHSPEIMFAEYLNVNERPFEEFEPGWKAQPDSAIIGRKLPVTLYYDGRIGIRQSFQFGTIEAAGFNIIEKNPVVWHTGTDSIITPFTIEDRNRYGWQASWRYDYKPFRGEISMTGIVSGEEFPDTIISYREPDFRLVFEAGWHRSFWNNEFETDISMSGKYIGKFDAYGSNGREEIGGAYPLDFRFTFRIHHITIYWGLHNWNSYQYYLVPGYKMIHKEEYWGINWLLIN
ncbi:hypothetical protein HQ587_01150 [bacterium]|nr:hypothetical protein [bacterium]